MALIDLVDPDARMMAASFKLAMATLLDDYTDLGLVALSQLLYAEATELQATLIARPNHEHGLSSCVTVTHPDGTETYIGTGPTNEINEQVRFAIDTWNTRNADKHNYEANWS